MVYIGVVGPFVFLGGSNRGPSSESHARQPEVMQVSPVTCKGGSCLPVYKHGSRPN